MFAEVRSRIAFWKKVDRIGPDVPWTHWRLHFKSTMRKLCESKFKAFGRDAEFRPGAYAICCSRISLGDRVVIRPGCMLFADSGESSAEIVIESDVLLGSGVHIYLDNHQFDDLTKPIIDQGYSAAASVKIQSGAWVGACAIILSGVVIGRNAVVGAGSVVTRSVPDNVVVAGSPARVVRAYGKKS